MYYVLNILLQIISLKLSFKITKRHTSRIIKTFLKFQILIMRIHAETHQIQRPFLKLPFFRRNRNAVSRKSPPAFFSHFLRRLCLSFRPPASPHLVSFWTSSTGFHGESSRRKKDHDESTSWGRTERRSAKVRKRQGTGKGRGAEKDGWTRLDRGEEGWEDRKKKPVDGGRLPGI